MIGIKNLIRHLKILLYISFSWRFFLSWRLYKKNRKKNTKREIRKIKRNSFLIFFIYFSFSFFLPYATIQRIETKEEKGMTCFFVESSKHVYPSQSVKALSSFEQIQKSTSKSDTYLHVVCYNPSVLRANEVATQELSEPRHMTPWPRRAAEAVGVCSVIETKQTISPAKF